ncbi:MAG TPA: MerR family transcriptional regulator [Blastocatellia bacterium]|nr:MerR family transcriptional regulator [Blastocatellia bacterium]
MEATSRIPQKLFFRIGEVCELIKVQPHVLRYWETEFPMLSPQKNRAGQRVYRRKDVEMVMRIRDLLYEEKFTIAGAKKKLLEEARGGASRLKVAAREAPEPDEIIEPPAAEQERSAAPETGPTDVTTSPEARLAIKVLKRNIEDLLTLLNSDASISR